MKMTDNLEKTISALSNLPAPEQFAAIVRADPCWGGATQIAELVVKVATRLENFSEGLWATKQLIEFCNQLADGRQRIQDVAAVQYSSHVPKILISQHPEHAGLLVLARSSILSEAMLDWIASTIVLSICARSEIDRGTVINQSAALSRLDRAWRALRKLPGNLYFSSRTQSPSLHSLHADLESILSRDELIKAVPERDHRYLDYLEVFWANGLGIRVSKRDFYKRHRSRSMVGERRPESIEIERFIELDEIEFILPPQEENYSPDQITEHAMHGNAAEELDGGTLYQQANSTYQPGSGQTAVSRAIRQRGQAAHKLQSFQMLPGGSSELTEYDFCALSEYLSRLKKPTDADVALWLVLLTGRPLIDVAETTIRVSTLRDDLNNPLYASLQISIDDHCVRVPIKAPEDRRKRQPTWGSVLVHVDNYFDVPLPGGLWMKLKYYRAGGLQSGTIPEKLFGASPSRLCSGVVRILSELNKNYGTHLTLARVEKHLFYELAAKTGDMIEACLLTGRDLPLGQSAGVYYHWVDSYRLESSLRSITTLWTQNTSWGRFSSSYAHPGNAFVGTDLVFNNFELSKFFRGLLQEVIDSRCLIGRASGVAKFHNALTNYVLMMLLFATGYRAVSSPIARETDANIQTLFLVIADKTDDRQSHSRIVPICETLARQLQIYQQHCKWIVRQLGLVAPFRWPNSSERPVLFYLDEDTLCAEEARPQSMVEKLSRAYRLPLNLNRHWLRGSLRDRGVPGEYVDAFMGHWTLGAEPFGRYSAMDPQDYHRTIRRTINGLMTKLSIAIAPAIPAVMNSFNTASKSGSEKSHPCIPGHMRASSAEFFGDRARAENLKAKTTRLTSRIEKLLVELWPGYADKEQALVMTEELMERIINRLMEQLSQTDRVRAERCLHKMLRHGARKYGWQLPALKQPASVVSRELSVTTPGNFEKLEALQNLDRLFWSNLEAPPGFTSLEEKQSHDAGELIFSFIAHSFCLSPMWCRRIPQAVREGICREGSVVWIDLDNADAKTLALRRIGRSDSAGSLRRRLFLAPTSQLLLLRWYRRWGNSWPRLDYQAALRIYLKRLEIKGLWKKADVMLMGMVRVYAALVLPGTLRAYVENGKLAPSIDTENFRRLTRQKRFRPAHHSTPDFQQIVCDVEQDIRLYEVADDDLKMRKKLRNGIFTERGMAKLPAESEQRKQAAIRVRAFLETEKLSPVLQLLALWSLQMLTHSSITGTLLPPATVRNYIVSVDRYLIGCAPLEIRDPRGIPSERWNRLYQECLDCRVGNTTKMAGRLAEFHDFLENAFGVEPASITEERAGSNVQARILSPTEYFTVLNWIEASDVSETLKLLRKFALILGYRLGMRRNEIYGIEYRDLSDTLVYFIGEPELRVRRNESGGVKTDSSVRRLPLGSLLSDRELEFVRSKVHMRALRLSGNDPKAPLFIQAGSSRERVPERLVFDYLIQALKIVTGDAAMRFHDLRHTAASYLSLQALTGGGFTRSTKSWWPGTVSCLEWDVPFPMKWPGRASHISKQRIWLTSKWLGHVGPGQSLSTYTHLLDWALRSKMWGYEGADLGLGWGKRVNLATQEQLFDLKSSALEKFRQRAGLSDRSTTLIDLCDLTVHRFGSDQSADHGKGCFRRARPGRWESYPNEVPAELASSISIPEDTVHLWAPFNSAFAAEKAAVTKGGLVGEAELAKAAAQVGITVEKARQWYSNGLTFMGARQPPRQSSRATDVPMRKRVGSNDPRSNRRLSEKNLSTNYPELAAFVAPYRSSHLDPVAKAWFQKLMAWYQKEPLAAVKAVQSYLANSQSSKSEQSFRDENAKLEFLNILRCLGLSRYTKVLLRIRRQDCKEEAVTRWAEYLNLPKSAFRCQQKNWRKVPQDLEFVVLPEVPASYLWRGRTGAVQNPFWSVLRFVVFTVAVICVEAEPQIGGDER